MPVPSDLQVLVFLSGSCPHCNEMKNSVLTNKLVSDELKGYYGGQPVILYKGTESYKEARDMFDVTRLPSIVIMDERRNEIKRGLFMTAEEMVDFLDLGRT